jgi:ubiquinone/menaquinone biosynthesis C-methylase UbiE
MQVMEGLVCPACRGDLQAEREAFVCRSGHRYVVIDGLPRFVESFPSDVEATRRSFDLQWKISQERGEYNQFSPAYREELVKLFLDDVMMPAAAFKGIRALDAGCGIGRWTYAMSELGANVTAIDYNDQAAAATRAYFKDRPSIRVMQADILRLPFAPESFDFVFAWGVLHYTEDPERAFEALARLVAPGGALFLMIFEYYNPMKLWITHQVRRWTVPMDPARLHRLSDYAARVCSYRAIRYPLKPFIDIGWSPQGNYDAFAKMVSHHRTAEQVQQLFLHAGFRDLTLNGSREFTNPVLQLLQGRWGGTIRMRGTRVDQPEARSGDLQVVRGPRPPRHVG